VITGRDFVCLSTQDWNGLWTRKQRFMKKFAENGNRVLYVETPVHLLGLDVLPGDPARFVRFLRGPRIVQPGLHVATLPVLLPMFQMFHLINAVNQRMIARTVRSWVGRLGFRKPILWIYTPWSAHLLDAVPNAGAIYECVDEFRAAWGLMRPSVVSAMEDELLDKVQLTVVTQENLVPRRAAMCPRTICIPNGADVVHLRKAVDPETSIPADLDVIPRPRFGFLGYIHYWIDLNLIRFLAVRRPDWSFVLIGPANRLARTRQLKGISNIHWLGPRPHALVPAYLKGMDCCLNPYTPGELTQNVSPLKLYEYLAAGKPVVSTDMPEARKFGTLVHLAESYEAFLSACERVLASLPETETAIRRRVEIAENYSWDQRFEALENAMSRVFWAGLGG
jgi:glycosyltransferase involved in cell wall biosynthesis